MSSFVLENRLGGKVPLYFNHVRCDVIGDNVKRIDMSYYDKRLHRRRDPVFSNEFLRILEQ